MKINILAVLMACTFGAQAGETYQFNTCGATGPIGPTQVLCDGAYSTSNLNGQVTILGGIQYWTVPISGTYRIDGVGAQGANPNVGLVGGKGAKVSGEFELVGGQVLQIVVGQKGVAGLGDSSNQGNGGGGGFYC